MVRLVDRCAVAIVVLTSLVLCAWLLDASGRLRAAVQPRMPRIVIRPLSPPPLPPAPTVDVDDSCTLDDIFPEEGPGYLWGHTRVTRQRCKYRIPRCGVGRRHR